ncbi:MAG: hypothetical protein EBX40_00860 [Gammaproteobacteria bacterium]|nr:hypothetical protein [Gammaproteobacteria bacterium]
MIKHWHSFKNPLINDILINLTKIESRLKTLTAQDEENIGKLLQACEKLNPSKIDELEVITLFNRLPAAYMLYLVHKLQSLNTDLIMKIISYAQKHKSSNPDVASFFQRNMVFEKSQLLGRIFSTNRMESVLEVIRKKDKKK